jgi:chloramphenicol 3-O phosphotransferase
MKMKNGKIIFLNGVSSSGKTTLAKLLQERLTEPYYWIGADPFIDSMPKKYFKDYNNPVIQKTFSIFHHAIKFYVAEMGVNVIVEDVFHPSSEIELIKNHMKQCVGLLHEYSVLFVHVTCPLEELRRREKERGDRDIGQAERQISMLKNANPKDIYDISIDTHNDAKEECANKIVELLDYSEKFTAFKILWEQRSEQALATIT